MLQVARLAPRLLGESAELVREFLLRQFNDDGGCRDRDGNSDLYYTVFGCDGLLALQAELPVARLEHYLRAFGGGDGLDFVHLCCLARGWAALINAGSGVRATLDPLARAEILRRIEGFRSHDGGYHPGSGGATGTAYGGFLALGAYQDLQSPMPDPLRLAESVKALETPDGAWANDRIVKLGSTNATAAAIALSRALGRPVGSAAGDWLLARAHPEGGFRAAPQAPLPDLLSTATSLHALSGLQVSCAPVKESCLDFIDTLWTNEGGFHGHWSDDALDCEYTFYGLLALGHLSL